MEITKYTSENRQIVNTQRTKQDIQPVVTRHEILHNYLLPSPKKVAFRYKKPKYKKIKTFTLIVFTNTFNYSPLETL